MPLRKPALVNADRIRGRSRRLQPGSPKPGKKPDMRPFLNITKALADETRLRILMALRDGELCVCQLITLLEMAPSTISRHIYLLAQAGLIDKRKCGKWAYCSLANSGPTAVVKKSLALSIQSLAQSERIRHDAARLATIKTLSLEDICLPLNKKRRGRQSGEIPPALPLYRQFLPQPDGGSFDAQSLAKPVRCFFRWNRIPRPQPTHGCSHGRTGH